MIWWAVVVGTMFFSMVALIIIFTIASSPKNIKCTIPLVIRSIAASVGTSWFILAVGGAGYFPLPSIYMIAMSFGKARPADIAEWILLSCLVFQLALNFIAFYYLTTKKENQTRKARFIANGK